jgi:hypothetical protein
MTKFTIFSDKVIATSVVLQKAPFPNLTSRTNASGDSTTFFEMIDPVRILV